MTDVAQETIVVAGAERRIVFSGEVDAMQYREHGPSRRGWIWSLTRMEVAVAALSDVFAGDAPSHDLHVLVPATTIPIEDALACCLDDRAMCVCRRFGKAFRLRGMRPLPESVALAEANARLGYPPRSLMAVADRGVIVLHRIDQLNIGTFAPRHRLPFDPSWEVPRTAGDMPRSRAQALGSHQTSDYR